MLLCFRVQKIDSACFQLYVFYIYKNVIYATCPVYWYLYVLTTHALSHKHIHTTAGRFSRMWQARKGNSRLYICKLDLRTTRLPKPNYAWIWSEILAAMTKILSCLVLMWRHVVWYIGTEHYNLTLEEAGSCETAKYQTTRRNLWAQSNFCVYVYIIFIYTRVVWCAYMYVMHALCMYACMYVCMHAYMYVCIYFCM